MRGQKGGEEAFVLEMVFVLVVVLSLNIWVLCKLKKQLSLISSRVV